MARKCIKEFSREELTSHFQEGMSFGGFLSGLGFSISGVTRKKMRGHLESLGLDFNFRKWKRSWTKEQLIEAVRDNISMSATLQQLGLKHSGGHNRAIRQVIAEENIPTEHWLGQAHNRGKTWRSKIARPLEEILVENSDHTNSTSLKARLIKEGVLEDVCAICGGSHWRGKKLTLVLDHINGVHWDNRLENLRLLCPNCNSLEPTFCRGHRKVAPKSYCKRCGKEITKGSVKCSKCAVKNRPSNIKKSKKVLEDPKTKEMLRLVEEDGWNLSQVGREYGISSIAVVKRIKRLGWKPEVPRGSRKEKVLELIKSGVGFGEIAKRENLSRSMVKYYAKKHGLKGNKAPKIEIKRVEELLASGLKVPEIAKELGVCKSSLYRRLKKAKIDGA